MGFGDLLPPVEVMAADQLRFTQWELRDMKALSLLFRTPRGVKRFLNTYRLLRAMVTPNYMTAFEGTAAQAGAYRWPMLMLGVVAGFPNTGARFLATLEREAATKPALGMSAFLDLCFRDKQQPPARAGAAQKANQPIAQAAPEESRVDAFIAEWNRLHDSLLKLQAAGALPPTITPLREWLPGVARFTFSPAFAETLAGWTVEAV